MDSFLLVDNVAFECARPVVAPLEVRFAPPVRLPPDTHSQGHGRPCLQSRHRRPGFAACGLLHIYCINGWTRPPLVSGDVEFQRVIKQGVETWPKKACVSTLLLK